MSVSPTPRRLLGAAERLDSIERAAARAFGRTGFSQTSMSDVAKEAGISKVIVYRHIESKEALYRSILERVSTTLRSEFTAALESADEPATVSHLATARANPDGYRLLFQHAEREPEFSAYAGEIMTVIVDVADMAFGELIAPPFRRWGTELTFRWLVQSVLTWLDHGSLEHDAAFVAQTSAGLASLIKTLTGEHPS